MNRLEKKQIDHHDLRQKRHELHGKRRKLHERLSEICEDFVVEDLTEEHKQKILVRELRYLLDFYEDPQSWMGVE
jgi:hypothetical protein